MDEDIYSISLQEEFSSRLSVCGAEASRVMESHQLWRSGQDALWDSGVL